MKRKTRRVEPAGSWATVPADHSGFSPFHDHKSPPCCRHTLSESFQPRLKLGTLVEGVTMASTSKLRAAVRTLVKTRERPRRRIRRRVDSKGSEKLSAGPIKALRPFKAA